MSVDSANSQERTLPVLISTKFVTNISNRPIFLTKFEENKTYFWPNNSQK